MVFDIVTIALTAIIIAMTGVLLALVVEVLGEKK